MDRVSIRFYSKNREELISLAMYDKIKKKQLNGKTLTRKEHPDFFQYINHKSVIKIDSIKSNQALENMIRVFFSQDGMINSLLGSKISEGNHTIGFIFFQSKKQINWDRDDILFANQIASNISMMLANSKLIDQNAHLETIVENRTSELKHQIEIAEKANQAKSQFLSNMSHEIRTPLNAILGFISLVDRNKVNPELQNYFSRIEFGAHQLYDIINDVLDMAKIESGKFVINPQMIDLDKLFNAIILTFEAQLKQKNLSFHIENNLKHKNFFLDEIRIKQILNNLISNAIKFTHKGFIRISLSEEIVDEKNSTILLNVEDTGIGIKNEEQAKLFQVFEQLDQSKTKSYQGTGLGLAITKAIIEEMRGNITFKSQVGKGSTFYVKITTEYENTNFDNHLDKSLDFIQPQNLKFNRILIVDDNQVNLEFIHDVFELSCTHIDLASNGYEAIKCTEEAYYDLIIMDIHMPKINGYQTSRLIKMNPKNKATKIIALSADALDEKIKKHEMYGIDKYLIKPISSKKLLLNSEQFFFTKQSEKKLDISLSLKTILTNEIGVDFDLAMTFMGNKSNLYIKLLKQYTNTHKNDMLTLKEFLKNNEQDNAKRLVHNLKGVFKTLGFIKLESAIIDFEIHLMKLDTYYDNNPRFLEFQKCFEENLFLITYISNYISED